MNDKLNEFCALVLNEIRNNASKSRPIKLRRLCRNLNLNRRQMQKILFELRKDYPIVAKETDGGGYWIAECEEDVIEYNNMMRRRMKGYMETIYLMERFLPTFGNIPYIE